MLADDVKTTTLIWCANLLVRFDDSSEGLVELPDSDVILRYPRSLQRNGDCLCRCHWEIDGINGRIRKRDNPRQNSAI